MDLLEPTESITRCPYKGVAHYWSARVGDKLVKGHRVELSGATRVPEDRNLLSFYNEACRPVRRWGAARSTDHAVLLTSRSDPARCTRAISRQTSFPKQHSSS